jgi:phosphoglycolate phosphatase
MMEVTTFDLSPVKGVVFDMDGTLIHSHIDFTRMNLSAVRAMVSLGVPEGILDRTAFIARNYAVGREFFLTHNGPASLGYFDTVVNEALIEVELDQVHSIIPVSGAKRTVERLRDDGYKVGILTRGSRTYATKALEWAGLAESFETVVCRDDYPDEESKPNGKALHNIAGLLGIGAHECLMLGDHWMDMRCAQEAGALFLGVLTGTYDGRRWSEAGLTATIESVASLERLMPSMSSCR